jgi:hypothetical protein
MRPSVLISFIIFSWLYFRIPCSISYCSLGIFDCFRLFVFFYWFCLVDYLH